MKLKEEITAGPYVCCEMGKYWYKDDGTECCKREGDDACCGSTSYKTGTGECCGVREWDEQTHTGIVKRQQFYTYEQMSNGDFLCCSGIWSSSADPDPDACCGDSAYHKVPEGSYGAHCCEDEAGVKKIHYAVNYCCGHQGYVGYVEGGNFPYGFKECCDAKTSLVCNEGSCPKDGSSSCK